jgi:hypothetical protein
MSNLPIFKVTNTTGMTTGSQKNLYRDLATLLQTINKNNRICAPLQIKYQAYKKKIDMQSILGSDKRHQMLINVLKIILG